MEDIIALLESKRRELVKGYLIMLAIILTGLVIGLIFLPGGFLFAFIPALLAAAVYYAVSVRKKEREYKKSFKHDLVETALRSVFTDLVFIPERGIPESVIKSTGMMQTGNTYSSDDYISGRYKDIGFEQSDVCIQDVTTDSEGNTQTTTYFKGRWMIFEFNKSFKADLQVRESGFRYAKKKGGWFTRKEEKMKKVELEDAAFNKAFGVYAQNEHEAFYILTPHIMDSIKALSGRTDGKILLCFVASRLHVGVNSGKNAFEAPVFKKLDSSAMNSVYNEINIITRFVDELSLDRDIFGK